MSNYQSINCCDKFRNIDRIMDLYQEEKERILNLIVEADEKNIWNEILSRDPHCMCHAGRYNKYSHYTCAPCTKLSRIVDMDKNIVNKPFILECGEKVGESLILISLPMGKTHAQISREGKESAIKFLNRNALMKSCGTPEIENLNFLQLDTFTNNVIVWWIINDLLSELPYALPLYTSYICRDVGFILSNAPTIGNYWQFKKVAEKENWDISEIAVQIACILSILSAASFIHGNPSLDTLVFSDTEVEHECENAIIYSPFVTHLIDFSYSSVNLRNTRLYSKSSRSNVLLDNANLHIDIKDEKYKLDNKSDVIFNYIRHSGLPIYTSSFDFYCYLVSLMIDSDFYDAVKSNKKAFAAWSNIWHEDEATIIESRIKKHSDTDVDVVSLIGGLWLHCNVVKIWLSYY